MNTPTPQITNTKLVDLLRTYWAWRRLWIATTVIFGGFGFLYVLLLKSDMWIASQGLIVRDEANGAVMRLGRFQSQTEMKAAQETILEMARNNQVLREALLEIGPEKKWFGQAKMNESWPSQREVAELADEAIGVRAPKGAEFGTTEVIYLDIKQSSRQRAMALNRAVCQALDNRLRQVRVARADGVINELVRASSMATEELTKATEQLQAIEREAGADLSDLRGLSENNGASSTSRAQLETVKTELRQIENQHANLVTDLALLRETQTDPDRILSAPASILSAHPGLKKLREGLADAQLSSSQLRGRYADNHPLVYVALSSEKEIKAELQSELALALGAATKDVENSQRRLDTLKRQQQQLEDRLIRLAQIRTGHETLNQEVRSRTKILQDAERQLADTRAARDAALTTSLLTRIDEPVVGERPVGPGRTTILAGLTMAGLLFGLGIVFLLTPLDGSGKAEESWNERLGRRLSDRFPWLADKTPDGSPRRRRTDVERRAASRVAATTENKSGWFGRRQSDQLTDQSRRAADRSQMVTTPVVQQDDPATADRLDAMLLSELSAVIPTKTVETQASTNELESTPTVSTADAAPIVEEPKSMEEVAANTDDIETPADPAPIAAAEKKPIKPRLVDRTAVKPAVTRVEQDHIEVSEPTSSEAPSPVTAILAMPMAAEPVPMATLPVEPVPVEPMPFEPVPVASLLVDPQPVASVPVEPQPVVPPAVVSLPVEPLPLTPLPTAFLTPSPVPPSSVPAAAVPIEAATSMLPSAMALHGRNEPANVDTKSNNPSRNMFRPNQALVETPQESKREPQRPRRAEGRPNSSTSAPSAPTPAPLPLPLSVPFPSNAFETPLEGGLAGIGLPTQKLPDSFQFRQT